MSEHEHLDLGRVGLWAMPEGTPMPVLRDALAEAEALGYGALWFGTIAGREAMTTAALLLDATERMVVATGIANIAGQDAATMARAQRTIAEAHPGRFLLGLGGHRVRSDDGSGPSPLERMRSYLDAMDAAAYEAVPPAAAPRRVIAALGPKMLELAADRCWGAHPSFVPVEHTATARSTMGPGAFLGVEQGVIVAPDRAAASRSPGRTWPSTCGRRRISATTCAGSATATTSTPAAPIGSARRCSRGAVPRRSQRGSRRTSTPAPTTCASKS